VPVHTGFFGYLNDYETVRIPPLMSRKMLGTLDGGRGVGVLKVWIRAEHPGLLGDDDTSVMEAVCSMSVARIRNF